MLNVKLVHSVHSPTHVSSAVGDNTLVSGEPSSLGIAPSDEAVKCWKLARFEARTIGYTPRGEAMWVGLTSASDGEPVRMDVRDEVAEVWVTGLNRFEMNFRARFFFGGGEDMAMGAWVRQRELVRPPPPDLSPHSLPRPSEVDQKCPKLGPRGWTWSRSSEIGSP
jgi:hypothetical protein